MKRGKLKTNILHYFAVFFRQSWPNANKRALNHHNKAGPARGARKIGRIE
jgi:hypothetical protein